MTDQFPSTQWSVVMAAKSHGSQNAKSAALEQLIRLYWVPVYAYIRRRVATREDAEDLTQGFFSSLVARPAIESARPEAGRFRAFLLASVKHFIANEWDRQRALKRGGSVTHLPLNFGMAEEAFRLAAASADANPEVQYEREWALAAWRAAEEVLRQEFVASGKAVQFEAFRPFLSLDEEAPEETPTYGEIAEALDMSAGAVKVAVHRARRRFGEILRAQVADTVVEGGGSTVEDEVDFLFRVFGGR